MTAVTVRLLRGEMGGGGAINRTERTKEEGSLSENWGGGET